MRFLHVIGIGIGILGESEHSRISEKLDEGSYCFSNSQGATMRERQRQRQRQSREYQGR